MAVKLRTSLVCTVLVLLELFLLVNSAGNAAVPQTANGNHSVAPAKKTVAHGNSSSEEHKEGGGDHSGGHHGVVLAAVNMAYVETPLTIALFILGITLGKAVYCRIELLQEWVPESCILITAGAVCGAVLFVVDNAKWGRWHLDTTNFFLFLLPPIMLEAGYGLHDRTFFENIGSILLYAVMGTVMAFSFIGLSNWGISLSGVLGLDLPLLPSLLFASWIVAVDPVAILAIFQDLGVDRTLYLLVFGESLLNDGVTVVLYNVMRALCGLEEVTGLDIFLGILSFFTVALGGMIIGIFVGGLTAFILRFTPQVKVMETMITLVMAYLSYVIAMLFDWSGIISVVCCALMQAQYAFPNIHQKSATTVKYVVKMSASLSESFIFLFLGLELVSDTHIWNTGFCLWSLFFCLLFRFLVTFVLTAIINSQPSRVRKISLTEQLIMGYGGLRGAIAFALAVMVDPKLLAPIEKPVFVTTTLFIILFTTFLQGLLTKPVVRLLKIRLEPEKVLSLNRDINTNLQDHIMSGVEGITGRHGSNYLREFFATIDEYYVKPVLIRGPTARHREIMEVFEKLMLKMHYAGLRQGHGHNEKLPPAMERALMKCASASDFTLLANAATLNSRLMRPMSMEGSESTTVDLDHVTNGTELRDEVQKKLRAEMLKSGPNAVPSQKLNFGQYNVDDDDLASKYLQELKKKHFVIYRLHKQVRQSRTASMQNLANAAICFETPKIDPQTATMRSLDSVESRVDNTSAAGYTTAIGANLNVNGVKANGQKDNYLKATHLAPQSAAERNAKGNWSEQEPERDRDEGLVIDGGYTNRGFEEGQL